MLKIIRKLKAAVLTIDYPKPKEAIWGGHYAARISAPMTDIVEISIDGNAWSLCRNEAGHWWHDMQGLSDGKHKLTARLIRNGDNFSTTREFAVSRAEKP
jgi:hypothetical protein